MGHKLKMKEENKGMVSVAVSDCLKSRGLDPAAGKLSWTHLEVIQLVIIRANRKQQNLLERY